MSAAPSFSIVVPTYQRREVVCDAVRAIVELDYPGAIDLTVVVDGSTDGTAAALRAIETPFPFEVIEQPNRGAAAARNRGAAEARGEIILFLDDDMICESDILGRHADSYAEGADAVLGDIPLDPGSPRGFLADAVARWSARRRDELSSGAPLRLHDLLTGQLSVRRTVYEALGGFDERFTAGGSFGNEDLDFGVRLLERYTVRFNSAAVSRQRYVVTPRAHLRQWREAGEADVRFAHKHPELGPGLFAQHGIFARRLAAVPAVARAIERAAVGLAERAGGRAALADKAIARLFFAARDVAYWRGVRATGGETLSVLCYHAIADLSGDPVLGDYGIERDRLATQLDALSAAGCAFVGASEVLALVESGVPLPRRAVLVTFDDCYAELIDVARAVLRPRGIPAVAFAVSGLVGGTNEWDRPLGARTLELADAAGLAELAGLGVEIGCHSRRHRDLKRLDEAELAKETAGAADDLEALGLPRPRLFAYPYGELDSRARAAVRRAGFAAAFGLERRRLSRRSDRFALPRFEVLASAPTEAVLEMAGAAG